MKTNILDVPVDVVNRREALDILLKFIKEDKNHLLITPNPEIIMKAQEDRALMDILKRADLVVPDGIGVVLASRLNKAKLPERVAGYDLVMSLFEAVSKSGAAVYLLGAAPGVAHTAKVNLENKYPGLCISGFHDGYFNSNEEAKILEEIRILKPDILLVGLGFPRQEKWMDEHRDLPVRISAGVGGSIDVMAGKVRRAPELFRRLGLEWVYRLISQPKRFLRMMILPVFVVKVIKRKIWDEKK